MLDRRIVIINQASNYLTISICNEFSLLFKEVVLITGSIHEQGEQLSDKVKIHWINKFEERSLSKKFLSYIRASFRIYFLLVFKYSKFEILHISLPPMGYLLNLLLRHKFSMLIWDVYPDILKISGISNRNPLHWIWAKLNKKSFRKCFKLFTIGEKTADLLAQYTPRENINIQVIWSIFSDKLTISKSNNPFAIEHKITDKFIVQYSGNIGVTHNVASLIHIAKALENERKIVFQIIGRGANLQYITDLIKTMKLTNCMVLPFQTDEMFPYSLSAADIGVVILDRKVSKGSVPSKSYNIMSQGIPSLYIASEDSELFDYSKKYKHGKTFEDHQIDEAANYILTLFNDKPKYHFYSNNALKASKHFSRRNAANFPKIYLEK